MPTFPSLTASKSRPARRLALWKPRLCLAGGVLSASTLLIGNPSARAANTVVTVLDSSDLSFGAITYSSGTNPNATNDVQFNLNNYTNPAGFDVTGAALIYGTLDDTSTQALVISNNNGGGIDGSITLAGTAGQNSLTAAGANAADMLFVAAGSSLTLQSATGAVLALNVNTTGNIDNAGTLNLNCPVALKAGVTATFTGAGATTLTGGITNTTGAVAINNTGGTVNLGGANAYTGTTTVTAGTLNLNGTLGNTAVTVNAGTLNLNTTGSVSQNLLRANNAAAIITQNTANAISGTAALTVAAGAVTLSQANNFTGATTLTGGALTLTSLNAIASSALTVTGGTLNLRSDAGGTLADASTAITGSTTISVDRTATGTGATVSLGALSVGANTVTIPASTNNYTLAVGPVTQSAAGLTTFAVAANGITPTQSLMLGAFTSAASATASKLSFTGVGNETITGNITQGAGNALTLDRSGAAGALILQGTSNLTGPVTITNGTIQTAVAGAFGSTSGIGLGGAGILALRGDANATFGNGTTAAPVALTGSGATINVGQATTAAAGTTLTLGTVALPGAYNLITTGTNGVSLSLGTITASTANNKTITNSIAAPGGLTVAGYAETDATAARTLTVTGTGNTTVTGPITQNGTTALSITKTTASALNLTSGASTFSGGVTLGTTGATLGLGADSTATGGVVTSGPSGTGNLNLTTAGVIVQAVGGAHTVGNPIVVGNVPFTIGGTNDLNLSGAVTWGGSQILTVSNTGTTTLSGPLTLRSDATTGQRAFTLLGSTGPVIMSGAIANGSTLNGIVTITSPGATTLSGNNTYSGLTTIGSAAVPTTTRLGSTTALGFGGASAVAGSTVVTAGSTLDLNGQTGINEPLQLNGTGVGNVGALVNTSTGATASITSGLAALGVGNAGAGYTPGTYTATITGGGTNANGAAATVVVGSTGVVTSIQVNTAGSGYLVNPVIVLPATAGTPTTAATFATAISGITLNTASTVGGAGNITVNGQVSGVGALTKIGTGTLTLAGTNTYTGATTITGGTVAAAAAGALAATASISVGSGGTMLLSAVTANPTVNDASDRVSNTAGISLAGGSFIRRGSFVSEGSGTAAGLGALTLTGTATVDFGSIAAGTLGTLAFGAFTPAGLTLNINNYVFHGSTTAGTDGTDDRLIFTGDQTANLANFNFNGVTANEVSLGGNLYEIVPSAIPEPSTWVLCGLGGALLVTVLKRKRAC